jgi:hypothetical protein
MDRTKIIQARYGPIEYGQWVDVKPVFDCFPDLRLRVCDVVFTDGKDLWPGKTKILRVLMKENHGNVVCELEQDEIIPVSGSKDAPPEAIAGSVKADDYAATDGLVIHFAAYGCGPSPNEQAMNVTERVQELVKNNSLDIVVNNSTLTPGQNPFRGKKKTLWVTYSYDGGEPQTYQRSEKDWLIIGQAQRGTTVEPVEHVLPETYEEASVIANVEMAKLSYPTVPIPVTVTGPQMSAPVLDPVITVMESYRGERKEVMQIRRSDAPMSAPALNDYLIRKFSISPQRLRAPMPIELRDFHRNDLAQLFAELGFKRGAEIGVAEGNYSEVLLKANPECELLLVDPWHAYSDNPQNKTKEKHEFAYNETKRKIAPYQNARMVVGYSMDVVRDVADNLLDFCYIDGHHSYPFVMADIIEWTKKVRSGGIVSGDDVYRLNEKWGAGPMEAIYDYTRAMRINPWFLINAHKSVDFFFVKP